jgi:hypothetical protein
VSSIFGEIAFPTQLLLSFALGEAASPALRPYAQDLANLAWESNTVLPPDVYQLAAGVAQGQIPLAQAQTWAHEQGISDTAFAALVNAANVGPPLGLAYELYRRHPQDFAFDTAVKRLGIEDQWLAALEELRDLPLTPDTIANAVHRNIMIDPTLIVREPPTVAGKVDQVKPSVLDPAKEASWSGMDHERLRVMVGTTGLPPGLVQMLQLYNRKSVDKSDVQRAVAQSNLRNEYMDVVLDLARHILTPHEYAEAELRGVIQDGSTGAGLSGLNPDDYQILFGLLGRPLNEHAVTTGLARGGSFNASATDYGAVPAGVYRDAIRRSNIRPEYAELAYANRYIYPSAFVLRSLAQAGDLGGQPAVAKVLEEIGWKPTFATQVSTAWTTPSTGEVDPHVKKAQTSLFTEAHKAYVKVGLSQAQVTPALTALQVPAVAQQEVFHLWDVEKQLAAEVPA